MADTTFYYLKDGVAVPYDSLSDEVKAMVNEARLQEQEKHPKKSWPEESYTPAVMTMLVFAVLGATMVSRAWKTRGTTLLSSGGDSQRQFDLQHELGKEYHIYHGSAITIGNEHLTQIISKRLPYFTKLAPELKDRFLQRTRDFMAAKTFLIKSNEPFLDMPVLLSATAVQLSFGLTNYLMPHFQYIRVFKEAYFAKGTTRVLAGHVFGNTITLAWDEFLDGNNDCTDGANVGLHEMAHALYYQYTVADLFKSKTFETHFNEVMAEGKEIYDLKRTHPSGLFSDYPYTNLQEFWAESVELFFERPADLQHENPDLYQDLQQILRQDPRNSLYPVA